MRWLCAALGVAILVAAPMQARADDRELAEGAVALCFAWAQSAEAVRQKADTLGWPLSENQRIFDPSGLFTREFVGSAGAYQAGRPMPPQFRLADVSYPNIRRSDCRFDAFERDLSTSVAAQLSAMHLIGPARAETAEHRAPDTLGSLTFDNSPYELWSVVGEGRTILVRYRYEQIELVSPERRRTSRFVFEMTSISSLP